MCEALPPTLEKNVMDLGGYVAICRYIVFLAPGATFYGLSGTLEDLVTFF